MHGVPLCLYRHKGVDVVRVIKVNRTACCPFLAAGGDRAVISRRRGAQRRLRACLGGPRCRCGAAARPYRKRSRARCRRSRLRSVARDGKRTCRLGRDRGWVGLLPVVLGPVALGRLLPPLPNCVNRLAIGVYRTRRSLWQTRCCLDHPTEVYLVPIDRPANVGLLLALRGRWAAGRMEAGW